MLFVSFGRFVSLALRDEVVAGEAGFDFHNIGFSAEVLDFCAENDFCGGHGEKS